MDYLNYGKQVQRKPHNFSFGNLNKQTTQPQVASQTKDELIQLFPTPLLICPCPFEYGVELEWIKKQKWERKNKLNKVELNHKSEDTFILDKPEMSRVRQFIELKLKEFIVNVMGSDSEMVITQSWLNKNMKGESNHEHEHPNSIISGVWYPKIHEQLPPIQFKTHKQRDVSLSIKNFNHMNSETFMLPMKMGELILFPSNLSHSVPANQSDEERISLSFNTWCKGSLGDEESLTYLPFDRLM